MSDLSATCGYCGGEVRLVSVTAEGSVSQCPCRRTTWTRLAQGSIEVVPPKPDLRLVPPPDDADD